MMATHKSALSTESPPFNPQRSGGVSVGSPAYRSGSRSRSTSPHAQQITNSPYPVEINNSQSNAVPKYSFEYQG